LVAKHAGSTFGERSFNSVDGNSFSEFVGLSKPAARHSDVAITRILEQMYDSRGVGSLPKTSSQKLGKIVATAWLLGIARADEQ